MAIGLHQLVFDPGTGAVCGSWTVHYSGHINTVFAGGIRFVDGVATGVEGRNLRRLVCANGPNLAWAEREDAPGVIGDAPKQAKAAPAAPPAPKPPAPEPEPIAPDDGLGGPVVTAAEDELRAEDDTTEVVLTPTKRRPTKRRTRERKKRGD